MIEELLRNKRFPSPLIVEGGNGQAICNQIAQYALCNSQSACGQCPSCKQVAKGFHPDWIQIAGDIKMDDLRTALSQLRQRPLSSQVRLMTLLEAENSNTNVQNALLKTLEEPQAHWILVLSTSSKWALLETIRSRCLIYHAPRSFQGAELTDEEHKIFKAIETADELSVYTTIDGIFKDRQKCKSLFQKLLTQSSNHQYPGHWVHLAPFLEPALLEIDRNLNPRLVFDRAWTNSWVHE